MSALQWFGEQSEAVKLALIGLGGGFVAGFWAAIKEWRKPVLNVPAPVQSTTSTAPRSADDPVLLILAELTALNITMRELLSATKAQEPAQNDRIGDVLEKIGELTSELYLLRNILNQRNANPNAI